MEKLNKIESKLYHGAKVVALLIVAVVCACTLASLFSCGSSESFRTMALAQGVEKCTQENKALFCHYPQGNPENAQTLCLPWQSYYKQGHDQHEGDHLGPCNCEEDNVNCPVYLDSSVVEPDAGVPAVDSRVPEVDNRIPTPEVDAGVPNTEDATVPNPEVDSQVPVVTEDSSVPVTEVDSQVPVTTEDSSVPVVKTDVGVPSVVVDSGTNHPENPVTPSNPSVQQQEVEYMVTGGCNMNSSGNSGAGAAVLIALVVLAAFSLRRYYFLAIAVIVAVVVFTSIRALAFPTQNFKPAPGTSDYWQTEDAKISLPSVKLLWHYENDPVKLVNYNTGEDVRGLINDRNTLHLLGAYSLYNKLQLSLDVPLVINQYNSSLANLGSSDAEGGLANIRFLAKLNIYQWKHVGVAVGLDVGLPTSTVDYVDDAGFTLTPKAIVSGYFGPVSLAANAGLRVRDPNTFTPSQVKTLYVENEFVGSLGAAWKFWKNNDFSATVVSDAFLSLPFKGVFERTIPVELVNGFKVGLPAGFEADVGVGVGLTAGVGAPDYRVLGGLSWSWEKTSKPVTKNEKPCQKSPKYNVNITVIPPPPQEKMAVPVITPVYFDFDKSTLTLAAKATLETDVEALKLFHENGYPIKVVVLAGSADRRGANKYNTKLALRRAEAVKKFLQENGVTIPIEVQSNGEEYANQTTTDELELQKDRKVTIIPVFVEDLK